MLNYLEQFKDTLRRLQQEGVNRRDKEETLQYMLRCVRQLLEAQDEEKRKIAQMLQAMGDNRTFSRSMEPLQMMYNMKRREFEMWEEVESTIKRLMM